eukprot:gene20308-1215_t
MDESVSTSVDSIYQASNFTRWRENGTITKFVAEAGSHVDCFSVHLYDTFTTDSSNPFDGNFSIREGSNLEATLDLQEVGTALLRPNSNETASATPLPLPMLFSEYGGGMKIQPLSYNIAHDWRDVKADVLFVKAIWDKAGMVNN